MGDSRALAVEAILEGKGLAKKLASAPLLSGLGARLMRASDLESPSATRDAIATTVAGLDRLLRGGLPRGAFVELSGRRSCGRFSIGIAALAAATSSGEAAALVDLGGHLDPQSAEEAGADLTRLLWVRPARLKEAVASAEMLLLTGFPLVVADLGLAPVRGRSVPDAAWVRLERAARSHGAVLLLLAPYRVSGVAAEAVVAADSARAIWSGTGQSPRLLSGLASRLTLQKDVRARSGMSEAMHLSLGDVPLSHPSPPAHGGRGDSFRAPHTGERTPGGRGPSTNGRPPAVGDAVPRTAATQGRPYEEKLRHLATSVNVGGGLAPARPAGAMR